MNKKLLLLLGVVVAIGAVFALKHESKPACKEPGLVEQAIIPQLCGQLVSIDMQADQDLAKQLCAAAHKEFPCELGEEDKPAAFKILDVRFVDCQKALFAQRGVCVDKVVTPER